MCTCGGGICRYRFIGNIKPAQENMADSSVAERECLYINNINEKVKLDVLKQTLSMVFSQYGKVENIIASSNLKKKGQAWVLFDTVEAASEAMEKKQGFNFYDKPLRIAYAKSLPKEAQQKRSIAEASASNAANKRARVKK